MLFFGTYLLLILPFLRCSSAGGDGGSHAGHHDHDDEDLAPFQKDANGDRDYLYAYFNSPLDGVDTKNIGPTNWKNLNINGNQCGGGRQKAGFGQSPIIVPLYDFIGGKCHANTEGYLNNSGNCTWVDIDYLIRKGSLAVRPKKGPDGKKICSLDSWKIPQSDKLYEATEVHIKSGGEHAYEGSFAKLEIQIFYGESSGETQAAFSVPVYALNGHGTAHQNDMIENFLKGWRSTFWETHDFCDENEKGDQTFNVNTVMEEKQKLFVCSDFIDDPEGTKAFLPEGTDPIPVTIPSLVPSIMKMNPNLGTLGNLRVHTYEGSLTTPPCTENVYWNVIYGNDLLLSSKQVNEIRYMINCVRETSTCKWSSAASEFGLTQRPPQPLNGRKIVTRCPDGPNNDIKHDVPQIEPYKKKKETKPYHALLFPLLVTFVGLFVYYFISRVLHLVPYTAILFLIGTVIGLIIPYVDDKNQVTRSTSMWNSINGELLLIAFLPGLLFKDAYCLDVHLFMKALPQTLIWAFPSVLGGTTLMAIFLYYILPYEWDFFLCMTFGAIVSATDPVAVAALLQELGAPPRLKTHISGESLLNDGSAIVFYAIFKDLYLYSEKISGGVSVSLAEGIWQFVWMSIGAAILGVIFGIVLALILYALNHRFNTEEKIVQVTATFCVAYLSFYIGEAILHMSGVIAVVFCGLTTKFVAVSLIIDHGMMNKFWALIEHLLNTILFFIGGVVWGMIISSQSDLPWGFADWLYLFATYIFSFVVRFFLFGSAFPIISRIGLKSSWKEMVFHAFGGLRGAVGIALAISLQHDVVKDTVTLDPRRLPTLQVFALVGGMSFFSLLINGSAAGYVLKSLKLNRSTKERTDILKRFDTLIKKKTLELFIILIGENVYKDIDFNVVTQYIPQLANLTYKDIRTAIKRLKYSRPSHLYNVPKVSVFESILTDEELEKLESCAQLKMFERIQGDFILTTILPDELHSGDEDGSDEFIKELRLVFLELVRSAYQHAMNSGYIDVRDGAVVHVLNGSVAITEDEISNGLPMNDWHHTKRYNSLFEKFEKTATKAHLATAFIHAHNEAAKTFKYRVHQDGFLSSAERLVLDESAKQVEEAHELLNNLDPLKLKNIMSLKLCVILLNNAAIEISKLVKFGLLKDEEGEHYFEHLEHDIASIKHTKIKVQPPPQRRANRESFLNLAPPQFTAKNAEYEHANIEE